MKLKVLFFLLMFSFSLRAFSGDLHCEIKDLATADILASKTVSKISLSDLKKGLSFDLEHDLVKSSFSFFGLNNFLVFKLTSGDMNQEEEIELYLKLDGINKKIRLGSVSISSSAANLDTLYSYCDFDPN